MKNLLGISLALALASAVITSQAQINVGSDGSDGPLILTTNDLETATRLIDLREARTANWTEDNSTHEGKGIYDPEKWAVVFKYSSVHIGPGVTVIFTNHPSRAPVVWLVQSNVTIEGTVSVNGRDGVNTFPAALVPTEPGPGGFRGAAWA